MKDIEILDKVLMFYIVNLVNGERDGEGRDIGNDFFKQEKLGSSDTHLQWAQHRHLSLHALLPLLVILGFSFFELKNILIEWHLPLELDGHDEWIVSNLKLDGVCGGVCNFILGGAVLHEYIALLYRL